MDPAADSVTERLLSHLETLDAYLREQKVTLLNQETVIDSKHNPREGSGATKTVRQVKVRGRDKNRPSFAELRLHLQTGAVNDAALKQLCAKLQQEVMWLSEFRAQQDAVDSLFLSDTGDGL